MLVLPLISQTLTLKVSWWKLTLHFLISGRKTGELTLS